VDHLRVEARAGERRTIEVEARRLGAPVAPVVTVFNARGSPLTQRYETPGVEGDCRFDFTFPDDGSYTIQVRDNLYRGADGAVYRLRVSGEPYATGLFPLGGQAGRAVEVFASGGSLLSRRSKTVTLPDEPGAVVDPGPFDGPVGPVTVPMRLVVGTGPERVETEGAEPGTTLNGRIDRPGEVDRYRLEVRAGEPVRVAVVAAALGSWLDPVLTVRNDQGVVIAENDDAPSVEGESADSRLDLPAGTAGKVVVEVTDRFGDGGPGFAYRLVVGPPSADFGVELRPQGGPDAEEVGAGPSGAFHLRPGEEIAVPFRVRVEGRTGPITVRAGGLPTGVSAAPVTIRPAALGGSLRLRAAPDARRGRGEMQVVATATTPDGLSLRRLAFASLALDAVRFAMPSRPVTVRITRFPVSVVSANGEAGVGH
jgi:hypothetical protein